MSVKTTFVLPFCVTKRYICPYLRYCHLMFTQRHVHNISFLPINLYFKRSYVMHLNLNHFIFCIAINYDLIMLNSYCVFSLKWKTSFISNFDVLFPFKLLNIFMHHLLLAKSNKTELLSFVATKL
jgi:hypothetical protein